jgi:hypothetical protein
MSNAQHTPVGEVSRVNAAGDVMTTFDSEFKKRVSFAGVDLYEGTPLVKAASDLLEAAEAALTYDEAIRACADDPNKMASFCTTQGDDLDALYDRWINLSRAAIAKAKGQA